ncbi:MAG: peptidase M75, Imelysin [Notoacmeibacter sp.]|nr:peptidase M75, Imelysin [Notoacmeibacter sp.]MCC0032829.1 peptidase M75, Imelysin [Brucellaceae bacterium]
MRPAACLAAIILATGAAHADETQRQQLVRTAVESVILPGYAGFDAASGRLADHVAGLCTAPSEAGLEKARAAFGEVVEAWSQIEYVQFGPVRADNRLERILFFPDRRGIGLKQIQQWIGKPGDGKPDAASMPARSAAVQGLPALEFTLFGSGSEALAGTGGAWRCAVGQAIAGNVASIAGDVLADWQGDTGIRRDLENPDEGNALYRSADEALAQVLKVLPNGYEMMEETRLKPVLGDDPASAKPKAALFWRSGLTARALSANLDGLAALAAIDGIADGLPDDLRSWVPGNIAFETAQAKALLAASGNDLPSGAATAEGHARLMVVAGQLESLRDTSATGILGGYGLAAGFSSLDGD